MEKAEIEDLYMYRIPIRDMEYNSIIMAIPKLEETCQIQY
jgi:hypothetical protein